MIECIFTLDYEIYGNGTGSLRELVYEPANRLRDIFLNWNARFVNFVEVAEFEKIEAWGTDPAVDLVKSQVKALAQEGFEIGLHLHPQWCNARHEDGHWLLDRTEYNLCALPRPRVVEIVKGSLGYLSYLVNQGSFTPISFRAGNWLFQPTDTAASVLGECGIRIDSSVFKGGLQHNHTLDYRPALKNGYCWPFGSDVNTPDPAGAWMEVPIYTEMVPAWRMATSKRLGLAKGAPTASRNRRQKINRALDLLRFRYPLKLDFCRMTLVELTMMMDNIIREDRKRPDVYKPIVAIGHTKDLLEPQTVDDFLAYLREKEIPVSTFETVYPKLAHEKLQHPVAR